MAITEIDFKTVRVSEWICVAYFGWVMVAMFFFPLTRRKRVLIALFNCGILGALLLIPYGEGLTSPLFISVTRDWLPAVLILVAYHEGGLLTSPRPEQALERALLGWDQTILRETVSEI